MFMLFSCSKENRLTEDNVSFSDPNWIKLEIPGDREAHAVYGSIDDTLLVSTIHNIYQITNNGSKINKLNKQFNQAIFGFAKSNDTLYALTANHLKNTNGFRLASYAQNYSLDKGVTWQWTDLYKNKVELTKNIEFIKVNNTTSVNLKENIDFFPNSTTSGFVLKRDIIVNKDGKLSTLKVPFTNQLTSLHQDNAGRLYISASSGLHDEITKKYSGEEKGNKAIVYISKKSISDLVSN